jgi:hypothetical protein
MSHGRRWGINAGMLAMAVLLGLGWQLAPRLTTICVVIALGAGAAAIGVHGISARLGRRRAHAGPEED